MRDAYDRRIDYMRVSITDRCNLRCKYCMPEDIAGISHNDILRYEEILRLCTIFARMGIKNIKVTGGEPLVRRGCVDFIRELKAISGIESITLTTNAVLLEPYVEALAQLKIDGINISLDSLNPEIYQQITGRDELHRALRSLNAAIGAGHHVKVNCVPIKGLNENEILPITRLAERSVAGVRFIELMPSDAGGDYKGVSGNEIIRLLSSEYTDLEPDCTQHGFGPARYFRSSRLKGAIGLIDAVSNHFCSACNRLRLTSEGYLKLCLFNDIGLDLRGMLRSGAGDSDIEEAIASAVYHKPERYPVNSGTNTESGIKKMSQIGG